MYRLPHTWPAVSFPPSLGISFFLPYNSSISLALSFTPGISLTLFNRSYLSLSLSRSLGLVAVVVKRA